jgi:hypothetical protein
MDTKFIESRRLSLEKFVKYIASVKHLHYSEEFRLFLRNNLIEFEKVKKK